MHPSYQIKTKKYKQYLTRICKRKNVDFILFLLYTFIFIKLFSIILFKTFVCKFCTPYVVIILNYKIVFRGNLVKNEKPRKSNKIQKTYMVSVKCCLFYYEEYMHRQILLWSLHKCFFFFKIRENDKWLKKHRKRK